MTNFDTFDIAITIFGENTQTSVISNIFRQTHSKNAALTFCINLASLFRYLDGGILSSFSEPSPEFPQSKQGRWIGAVLLHINQCLARMPEKMKPWLVFLSYSYLFWFCGYLLLKLYCFRFIGFYISLCHCTV